MKEREIDYKKFRWFFTSNGILVIGGKSAEQNEDTVPLAKEGDIILHTKLPGSPFCIIKSEYGEIKKTDIEEAAVFCACFSQQWKKDKKEVEIHYFSPIDITKNKIDKKGTFHVKKILGTIKANLELYLTFQEDKLRAVPKSVIKNQKESPKENIKIIPGEINKEEFAKILKEKIVKIYQDKKDIKEEEILGAIPSGGFSIK